MPQQWDTTRSITVRQLLGSEVLRSATLTGGADGTDRDVRDVIVSTTGVLGPIEPSTLVVLDGSTMRYDSYQVDLAMRAIGDADGAALVLTSPGTSIGVAAARLANKLGLPFIVIPHASPLVLGDQLRQHVYNPRIVATRLLLDAMASLARISQRDGVEGVLTYLSESLESPATLAGSEGTAAMGAALEPPLSARDRLPVAMTTVRGTLTQVAHPIQLAAGERPSFWLVARREDASDVWAQMVGDILQIAAWSIGARLAGDRLRRERDARFRLGVLNQIIAAGDNPEPALTEQIGVLGWAVDGWCSAIHVQASGSVDPQRLLAVTDDLQRNYAEAGFTGQLIERPDGWTSWEETSSDPPPASYARLIQIVRNATTRFVGTHPGVSLHVGIGTPHQGVKGLRNSLAEAREASILAQAVGGDDVVQHIDELGIRRILFGWYASETFTVFAKTLLEPLERADPDGDLTATLECFLDCQSSPTLTATTMNLHRNTILNRMERIRSLLSVDLERADERLAVQLACRIQRLHTPPL